MAIPCDNEAATAETVEHVLASPYTAEIVIVDDGSTDGMRNILAHLSHARLGVNLKPYNQGKALRCAAGSPRRPPTT